MKLRLESVFRASNSVVRYVENQQSPSTQHLSPDLNQFNAVRHKFKATDKLIVRSDDRIVVPVFMRQQILSTIHEGHPGVVRMKRKLKESLWWPNVNSEIELLVNAVLL